MSYIRALQEPDWEEGIGTGYYVYSDGNGICGLPREHRPFIEVVMRMLDQSDRLDQESLEQAHGALRERLGVEEGTPGRTEPDIDDALMGLSQAVAFCEQEELGQSKHELSQVYERLREER